MATGIEQYGDAVTATTDEYLESVRSCVSVLPATLLRYGEGEFAATADRLVERESTCDYHLRELRTVLGEARPNTTDLYLRSGDVMELYAQVDAVPNAAESFVRERIAVEPDLDEATRDDLAAMAALTTRATMLLTEVIGEFVASLVTAGPAAAVADAVDQVADLESQCDGLRQDVVVRAFERRPTAEAMLVRDLAESLDAAADAAEDAADHLLFLSSGV
ncbi:MAG: DUF47 family protein [Haloarculaceae archaeon]